MVGDDHARLGRQVAEERQPEPVDLGDLGQHHAHALGPRPRRQAARELDVADRREDREGRARHPARDPRRTHHAASAADAAAPGAARLPSRS